MVVHLIDAKTLKNTFFKILQNDIPKMIYQKWHKSESLVAFCIEIDLCWAQCALIGSQERVWLVQEAVQSASIRKIELVQKNRTVW